MFGNTSHTILHTLNNLKERFYQIDLSEKTWQRRTLNYLKIYIVMVILLVTVRYFTQEIRPDLRATEKRAGELTMQRDRLEIAVQSLTTPQYIQNWATQNNMTPFAESSKVSRDLSPALLQQPIIPEVNPSFEVNTKWK